MDINDYIPKSGRSLNEAGEVINKTDLMMSSLGQHGFKRITGTEAVTPDEGLVFVALQAETEAVIDESLGNVLDGAMIGAEGIRYGRFTSIKLTSGVVIAYQGV